MDTGAGATPRLEMRTPRDRAAVEAPNTAQQYELLLTKLARAEREIENGTSSEQEPYLEAASSIVFDLLYSLDFKRGGELVPRLAAIYGYIGNELLTVSRTRDVEQLCQLKDIITTLKRSWDNSDESGQAISP
ncbi:MAG TPA: flagellar protein FliS [Gemmatimonadaceae bacterium]|jgi:flagellar protein FliS|nr:flagellar protein FliS [Gemmatimonadaceae bacterium]